MMVWSLLEALTTPEVLEMESAMKIFIRVRESVVGNISGQTLAEYSLVLTAVAIAAFSAYRALGNNVGSLANGVDSNLTSG
jgi:Flp pilus assembly pilin Flp